MHTFFYDFTQNKSFNPLEDITHFYVSPYQMELWKTLNLAVKLSDKEVELVIQENTGLPLVIVPITVLNLGKCSVSLNQDLSGKISTGRRDIYFSRTKQDHLICISSVC